MESLQEIRTYEEFKTATDREVHNQAEGFVRLGYLLRRAEDTDVLSGSGYRTVTEFAKAEYGLTETYVSRYININRRYSEGGYSDHLQARFQGFGLAKLADMLTLPDEVVEVIPAEATRAEIQEIKREVAQEQQVSDLEFLMEQKEVRRGQQEPQKEDVLTGVLKGYYYDRADEYLEVYAAITDPEPGKQLRRLAEAAAPAGDAVKMVRVPGIGRMMLTVRGAERDPELLNVRTGEKMSCTWENLCHRLKVLFVCSGEARRDWEYVYQEKYPVKEEQEKTGKKAPVVKIARARNGENQKTERTQKAKLAPVQEVSSGKSKTKSETTGGQQERTEKKESGENSEKSLPVVLPEKRPEETGQEKITETPAVPVPEETEAESEEEQERDLGKEAGGQQAVEILKKEALEQTEEIRTALEKNYYTMAQTSTKKLYQLLDRIRKALDQKGVAGQMELEEYLIRAGEEKRNETE